jgi:glycosyltransferase involved in cell wall biosynthesis
VGVNRTPPLLSLIIAVYNKPENLRLVLAACARQEFGAFEIIVADDGSGPEVHAVVRRAQSELAFPLRHLWHEDLGWRKNVVLNSAIRAATTDYCVFIDGDCLPSRHFLLDHWNEREAGRVLLGRRVETSERWTREINEERVASGAFERMEGRDWADMLAGRSLRVEDGLRIRSAFLRRILLRNVRGMLGANFSVAKEDLVAVNGFDEKYDGPGCGEDSDIQFRLGLIGVTGKSLRNLAVMYHLRHPLTRVSDACWDRFEAVKRTTEPRCRMGLVHLEGPDPADR